MRCEQVRELLNAYLDGELPVAEREEVREHVAACADCRAEEERISATRFAIKEHLVRYKAPDLLAARIRGAIAQPETIEAAMPRRSVLSRGWLAAAGVAIALAGGAVGSLATLASRDAGAHAAETAVLESHIRSLMPGHLTDVASTDQHNVKPWFAGKVNLSPAVPRLDSAGFVLTGGRLDYVGGRAVAAVVYMRRQHVINVYS